MKKFLLPAVVVILLALAASCKKDSALEGDNGTNPTDSTGTNPGGGNGTIGKDSIIAFSDLQFGLMPEDDTYGRVFSYKTGKVYIDDSIPKNGDGKYINLSFQYFGTVSMAFASADPNAFDINIPGVTKTTVRNFVPDSVFRVASFDTLSRASSFKNLVVTDDGNSFSRNELPVVVFFKNSDGKKGVIKVKSLQTEYLVADVKMEY